MAVQTSRKWEFYFTQTLPELPSSMPVRSDFFEKEASAFNKKNSELFWTLCPICTGEKTGVSIKKKWK